MNFSENEKDIANFILQTPAPGKHCARNSIAHLEKAWKIKDIDMEMAYFRGITAEEESASAIFFALIRRKYEGIKKLKPRDHLQKNALNPFIHAVTEVLSYTQPIINSVQVIINKKQMPWSISVRYKVKGIEPGYFSSKLPFEFKIESNGKVHDFVQEMEKVTSKDKVLEIKKSLSQLGNRRNHILYASEKGIPGMSGNLEKFLDLQKQIVFRNLIIFLLVDSFPEKQLFAQQALSCFLHMLELLPENEFQDHITKIELYK